MIKLTTKKNPDPPIREVLFTIDDREYFVDTVFSAAFGLRYMAVGAEQGVDGAVVWLLREALGPEGYAALIGFEGLEPADFGSILTDLQARVSAAVNPGKVTLKLA